LHSAVRIVHHVLAPAEMKAPSFALALSLLASLPAAAQVVRGTVTEEGSGTPVPGALVTLLREDGRPQASVLADADGRFAIRAAAGRYRLETKRIGVRPNRSDAFDLGAGETRTMSVGLAPLPAAQPAVQVTDVGACIVRPGESAVTAALWEDTRTALTATTLSRRQQLFDATVTTFTRELDPLSMRIRKESRARESGVAERPFYSAPAADLSRNGYVRARPDGATAFFAPDADVLVSDAFAGDHCFRIERGTKKNAGLIGLTFEPVPGRELPDVRGTLWLDERSSELRRLEYAYTRFPNGITTDRTGGQVSYARLESGAWLVDRWSIRMPIFGKLRAQAGLSGDLGRSTRDTLVAFHEEGGEVASTALRALAPAALTGVVFDSTAGRPLAGAVVALTGTPYSATTDAAGRYRIAGMSDGTFGVEVRHARLDSLGVAVPETEVAVERGAETRLDLGAPRPLEVVGASPVGALQTDAAVVAVFRGAVRDEATGAGLADVQVIVGGAMRTTTTAGGLFAVGAQRPGGATLVLRKDGYRAATVSATLRTGDTTRTQFALSRVATPVSGSVAGPRIGERVSESPRLAAFNRHRASGSGKFFSREDIERRAPYAVADLLRGVSGLRVVDSAGVAVAVSTRGMRRDQLDSPSPTLCVMRVAVDGVMRAAGSINEVSPPALAGVEVYTGPESIPREYPQSASNSFCGLVVLWTRDR
jgi:carboxypeptidase family protein/TonB-dependent receptor-like protein